MSINKIVASALVGAAVSFAGFAQADVVFTKTTDGTKFEISDPKAFGDTKKKDNVKTAAEIEFLKTGKNIYVGDAKAEKRGKKRFGYWSCTQCHGPTAKGQVGPGLVGPTFKYPKDATNLGMFETIWYGTNGKGLTGNEEVK